MKSTRDAIAEPWGTRTPYSGGEEWPSRVDSFLEPGVAVADVDSWHQAASLLHSNGDAMEIAVKDGQIVGVRGQARDRVNRGRLGPKDLFGWQANHSPDRLTKPLLRENGELVETDWETAMSAIARRSRELLDEQGPSSHGFYTTGQFYLEDYYTLAIVARAGVGTNHLDGNTRLCTATAGEALKESFGCDGQPGSYEDVGFAEVIALFGHNVAETQPILWERILDRRGGSAPPTLIAVDPRRTRVAQEADLHLALRPGTNLALLNAIIGELIRRDLINRPFVEAHTVGFDELSDLTSACTPEWAAQICDVPADDIRRAAEIFGGAERILSTALQGVYQSHQATASACQVNNINLLRGSIGIAGGGVLQMNGQPTAENTRETGANGDLPGFRNWANEQHVAELAQIWNVEPSRIPHYGPPTHAMEIFRHCEDGSIRFLWISATNPAVSLPELHRIRAILEQERLFVVVQDIFLSETAALADIVLPAATWGEKTGTFTNADRTVHLAEQAVEPPGEARPDMEIFLDYARRMDFRDKDGEPLVKWDDPESAFEAWKRCSAGRLCDYSGLTYRKLRETGGIQWPCNAEHANGTERLYTDHDFWAEPERCESYGRDMLTGAANEPAEYRAKNPDGKAILKAAEYVPPAEDLGGEWPLRLNTGRTLFHFHTRTKTGRAPQLQDAAPEVWVELSQEDAEELGVAEGDIVEVASPRGTIEAPARITGMRQGTVFVPFHYGYWDRPTETGHDRAANELTITEWDPVSKQPLFKAGGARVTKLRAGTGVAPAPTNTASAPVSPLESSQETGGGAAALVVEELLEPDS